MPLEFKCIPHRAAPCIYDSRFDPTKTDLAHGGKVKRQHRYVSRDEILQWVGFESRHQYIPMNQETRDQNEKDRQKLLVLLRDLNVPVKGTEPLHQLGKTYNYWDPRMAHVRRKSGKVTELVPIIGLDTEEDAATTPEPTTCDKIERAAIIEFLETNGEKPHPQTGLVKLRIKKEAMEAKLEAAAAAAADSGDGQSGLGTTE